MYINNINIHFILSFHKSFKDMSALCTSYENLSDVEKKMQKKLAQEAKENDKYLAQVFATHETATCFDLQQVLTLPQGNSSFMQGV